MLTFEISFEYEKISSFAVGMQQYWMPENILLIPIKYQQKLSNFVITIMLYRESAFVFVSILHIEELQS